VPEVPSERTRRLGPGRRAYAIVSLAVVLAAGVTRALDPSLLTKAPFLLLLAAVVTASWNGGLQTGLATTLLAAVFGDFFLLPAESSLFSWHAAGATSLGFFLWRAAS
jgi:hypothetical protein